MKLHDLFGDSETQACAAAGTSRGVQSVELFKDPGQFFRGNCVALILDCLLYTSDAADEL